MKGAEAFGSRSGRTEEIPTIAFKVQKHSDLSIRLDTWCGEELDAGRHHPLVSSLEIIDAQEQSDPAGKLLAYDPGLMVTVRACQENAGCRTAGTHDNPALRTTIVGQRRTVLDQLEAQDVYEEGNRLVVIANDQSNQFEV